MIFNRIAPQTKQLFTAFLLACFFVPCCKNIPLVQTVSIKNAATNRFSKALVYLPATYTVSKKRFPTIYLLHGYSGDYTTLPRVIKMPHYADSFSVILVCPDGSYNAWYLNSPIDKRSQYDTYFFRDVIPYIDKHYRTIPSGDARAIIGTSMGGHGALTMLARHPEMFFGAGSISGILDLTQFPREWDIARILGPYENNKLRWEQHSFVYMADSLQNKNKHISIDCGTNDFALPVNRAAHSKLVALNIPHEYLERPGSHSLAYMRQVLGYHIGSLMESIKR